MATTLEGLTMRERYDAYGYPCWPGERDYATADDMPYVTRLGETMPKVKILLFSHPSQWCWACGAGRFNPPSWWLLPWYIERAHLSAGSGGMQRIEDERAVVLLCSLCHRLHQHHDEAVKIYGREFPALTDANVLWLKRERDPDNWDWEAIRSWWIGEPPEPVKSEWYEIKYSERH
jgi:hypothetical protein